MDNHGRPETAIITRLSDEDFRKRLTEILGLIWMVANKGTGWRVDEIRARAQAHPERYRH